MTKSTPTIAHAVNIYTLTDGTVRIIEHEPESINQPMTVFCEDADAAIAYLRDTDALDVNPAWYGDVVASE